MKEKPIKHQEPVHWSEKSSIVLFAKLDEDVQATENTRHYILNNTNIDELSEFLEQKRQPPEETRVRNVYGLIIIRDDPHNYYYLFRCDNKWNDITDTWHESLEEAKDQAEFEYTGISKKWQLLK